jgi:hypothetical protein
MVKEEKKGINRAILSFLFSYISQLAPSPRGPPLSKLSEIGGAATTVSGIDR